MTLVKVQPRRVFDFSMDLDRVFNGFWNGSQSENQRVAAWTPAIDVSEKENELVVQAELPGLTKENIQVNVEDNVLTISGEKAREAGEEGTRYYRTERRYGSFKRSLSLPSNVDTAKITASYKDGVLTLTLPRAEEARPKAIEIQ